MLIHLESSQFMSDLSVIILAAGGSVRMGKPKQLLEINGQSLIRKTVETALAADCSPVLVVLGNAFDKIEKEIAGLDIISVYNKDWQKGMAGSLQTGIQKMLQSAPHIKSVLLLLCDQPLITADYLKKMYLEFKKSGKPAIASEYNNIKGVPAIFDFQLLKAFNAGEGDFGARHLIKKLEKENQLAFISFPGGAVDLDTQEDYEDFLKGNG